MRKVSQKFLLVGHQKPTEILVYEAKSICIKIPLAICTATVQAAENSSEVKILKFRLWASIMVFVGSYLPLSLILLAQDLQFNQVGMPTCWAIYEVGCDLPLRNGAFSLSIFIACLICLLGTLAVLWSVNPKVPIDVIETKHIPAELMSYTLPYVVSFMNLDYQETGKFIGLAIFLIWIFLITYSSGQLILNPLLAVLGWRLYEVKYQFPAETEVHTGRALMHGMMEPGSRYKHSAAQDVLIIKARQTEE